VLEAFPGSFSDRPDVRAIGNPVRAELFTLPAPKERSAGHGNALRLLVLGGSQGALILNETVPAAVALLEQEFELDIWHQTGAATLDRALAAYEECGVKARVEPFIDGMAEAYGWADMVICRSGALTVSELAAVGLGAVLVPYPSAVDDHQTLNANYLVDAGAAVLLPQPSLNPESLATELREWAGDRARVIERSMRARDLAKPHATSELAEACLALEAAA